MMFLFVLGILGMLCALGALAYAVIAKAADERLIAVIASVVVGVIAVVLIAVSTIRVVPPRSVGIQITFGKVENSLGSGLHTVKPWSKVVKYPSTMEGTYLQGDGKGKDMDGPKITVHLANQTTAYVHVQAKWQIDTSNPKAVESLYTTWRSFGAIEPKIVVPELGHAVADPFSKYDPLAVLKTDGSLSPPIADMESSIKQNLQSRVGNGVRIDSVSIVFIEYDGTTQDKINAYSQAVADTRIAEQRKLTADAQRQANDALASSQSSKDPGVLTQNCLDVTERMTKEGKQLPAGWTCLGSGATPVVSVR